MNRPIFTVDTQATDRTLLTKDELRAAVGLKDGTRDADLARIACRVYDRITQACNVATDGAKPPTLRQESVTDTYRSHRWGWHQRAHREGDEGLILSRRPIVSITQVTEDGTVLVENTDYTIMAAAGILQRLCDDRPRAWCASTIVVSYDAGFATVPEGLKRAAERLLARYWSAQSRDPNLRQVSIPGVIERQFWIGSASDPDITEEIMDDLGPYMNPVII